MRQAARLYGKEGRGGATKLNPTESKVTGPENGEQGETARRPESDADPATQFLKQELKDIRAGDR